LLLRCHRSFLVGADAPHHVIKRLQVSYVKLYVAGFVKITAMKLYLWKTNLSKTEFSLALIKTKQNILTRSALVFGLSGDAQVDVGQRTTWRC
jgi:hypothetical protein